MRFALEDSLKRYAKTRNLTIVPADDPSAIYRVKGYLSAVGDTSGTLLVYTWDVSDAGGTRLAIEGCAAGEPSVDFEPWRCA